MPQICIPLTETSSGSANLSESGLIIKIMTNVSLKKIVREDAGSISDYITTLASNEGYAKNWKCFKILVREPLILGIYENNTDFCFVHFKWM